MMVRSFVLATLLAGAACRRVARDGQKAPDGTVCWKVSKRGQDIVKHDHFAEASLDECKAQATIAGVHFFAWSERDCKVLTPFGSLADVTHAEEGDTIKLYERCECEDDDSLQVSLEEQWATRTGDGLTAAAWVPISASKACEKNNDDIDVSSAEGENLTLHQCLNRCGEGCQAVDFFEGTGACNIFAEACETPLATRDLATSYSKKGKWTVISSTLSCEQNGDDIEGTFDLGSGFTLGACQARCTGSCRAIDFYKSTGRCQLYDDACANPQSSRDGASSYRKTGAGIECFPYSTGTIVDFGGFEATVADVCAKEIQLDVINNNRYTQKKLNRATLKCVDGTWTAELKKRQLKKAQAAVKKETGRSSGSIAPIGSQGC